MERRPYLLFELLIALSIVSLCIVPLVRTPFAAFKKEIESLEKIELQRIAELTFAEVKEQLYKNEIPWKIISEKNADEPLKTKITVSLGKNINHDYEQSLFLWSKKIENGKNNEEYSLFNAKIVFSGLPPLKKTDSSTFSQRFFISKIPKERVAEEGKKETKPS